jgi:hypothetical protein
MTDYSNARSEGYNRLAKHAGRDAFGYRNVEQPPPRHTLGLYSSTPTSLSCDQRGARSSSMSRQR